MTKKQITINEFIDKSIGEWKSIRSTHSLAFQEFENSTSQINIERLEIKNTKVFELLKKYNLKSSRSIIGISISWQAISDWAEEKKLERDQTILLFVPKNKNTGIVLRNKGYLESVISSSEYFIDNNNNLHLKTNYNSTISEETICFLSTHVRFRFSVIKTQGNKAVLQTSHSSEIRNLSTSKD